MRRGEVWVANLNPNKGGEVGKVRPVLVLQADAVTQTGLRTVLVVPLSRQYWRGLQPMRVRISARDRLGTDSWVMIEQVRAIDRVRFGDGPLTTVSNDEMTAVEKSLRAMLGIL